MTEDIVQHTVTMRIDKQLVKINCPPFVSLWTLEQWLAEYRATHPTVVIVSKSWSSNAAAKPE